MEYNILSMRLDLPFYFRLPSQIFFTRDPLYQIAAICPIQNVGEVSFSKKTDLLNANKLINNPITITTNNGPGVYKRIVTSVSPIFGEIATLKTDDGLEGGFSELRAYSEVNVFLTVPINHDAFSEETKQRAFEILNHFIDIYRIITQDPYIYRIDEKLDTYIVDFSLGNIPENCNKTSVNDILLNIPNITFSIGIGDRRRQAIRVNVLNDLYPGPCLDNTFIELFDTLLKRDYKIPLHYELIFTAQVELKKRNYHIAILEAETAFEVYITKILLTILKTIGEDEKSILKDMENPRKLGLLNQRLRKLDSSIKIYRENNKLSPVDNFIDSEYHKNWKNDLYKLRNRIIHEGWRIATFDLAKKGIHSCKLAIKIIEGKINHLANNIQINYEVEHLINSAGRLKF